MLSNKQLSNLMDGSQLCVKKSQWLTRAINQEKKSVFY